MYAKSSFIHHKVGKAMHWQNNGNLSHTITHYTNVTKGSNNSIRELTLIYHVSVELRHVQFTRIQDAHHTETRDETAPSQLD